MTQPSRAGVAGVDLAPLAYTLSYGPTPYGSASGQGAGWFGPSQPMRPVAPPEVAGRRWDYPTGYNLNTTARAYEPVSFEHLRRLADGYDLLRLVIETRKDQAARMTWTVKPRDQSAKGSTDKAEAIKAFLRRPDGINNWNDWLRMGLEDVLVIDAWSLFKQRSRAGDLLALEPVDGATIKPLLDDEGRTPQPWVQSGQTIWPEAYQQILKGLPAVNYTARDLLYRPRNRRTNRVYGFSPVEQVMTTVNIALRRQVMTLEYFTSGTVPDALIGVPEAWTPDQITAYQRYWDSLFLDNLAARRRARFVPGKVALHQTSEPQLKGEFDEWLSRIVCFAFSISPQALIRQMNRASADTQKEIAEEEGLAPLLDWIKSGIDDVIADDFEAPELEFAWQEEAKTDEIQLGEIVRSQAAAGLMTLNEARRARGLDPDPNPSADTLMVLTGSGYLPVDANTIEGKKANLDAFGPPPVVPGAGAASEPDEDGEQPPESESEAEVAKFIRRLLAKFDPQQPRDDRGKWTDGGGSSSADAPGKASGIDQEKEAKDFERVVLKTVTAGAIIAGGAIVTAMSGGTAPVAVAAAVWIAENYLLAEALTTSGRYIAAHLGYDEAAINEMIDGVSREIGVGKAAVASGELGEAKTCLARTVDTAVDAMASEVESGDGLDDERRQAALSALEDVRDRIKDKIAAQPAPAKKLARASFTKRRFGRPAEPVPFDRPATRRAILGISRTLTAALAAMGAAAAARIRALGKLTKSDPEPEDNERLRRETDEILDELDYGSLREAVPDIAEDLERIATEAAEQALAQIGADDQEALVDQVNIRAVAIARERAAELVGLRYDADGNLVPSANAEMTITGSTRDRLRATIASGLDRNIGLDAIADEIEASHGFSAERAATIAETEVARANGLAAVESYDAARAAGVAVHKAWWAEPGCCSVCQKNAEAGAIEVDDEFPSGDDAPPAHPSCRCVVVPVVEDQRS